MQPLKPQPLLMLFNRFADKEVPMTEKVDTFCIEGLTLTETSVHLTDPNDPTIAEMKKLANDNGISLRIWFPGSFGTADARVDRVNAYVSKDVDGKYRVSKNFNIG